MSKTEVVLMALLTLLTFNISACKRSDSSHEGARDSMQVQTSLAKNEESTIRFRTFKYVDAQGIGTEAFRVLIPFDWKFEGGIRWIVDNPGMPAVASSRIYNPSGIEELEVFPNQAFFWTDNPTMLQTFPAGTRYFGNEVLNKLALAYIQQAKFEQATDALNKILGIAAAFRTLPASPWIQEAAYCNQLTRQSQALIKKMPVIQGEFALRQQKFDVAFAVFSEAVKGDPDSPALHTGLAIALANMQKHDEALRAIEKAIQLQPGEKALAV